MTRSTPGPLKPASALPSASAAIEATPGTYAADLAYAEDLLRSYGVFFRPDQAVKVAAAEAAGALSYSGPRSPLTFVLADLSSQATLRAVTYAAATFFHERPTA